MQPDRRAVFEFASIPKAVAALAVPTVISQVVTIIYNLADTFFIGQMGDPYMVAAVSLVLPWFNLLTALGNLFGIGGSSYISRLLGAGEPEKLKTVSAFSFWAGFAATVLFSFLSLLFCDPIVRFLGASSETILYASEYLIWVVVLGGIPTALSMTLAHLLRGEGHARESGIGLMLGGAVNLVLDPIFIFCFGMGVNGAALATALSNLAAMCYFIWVFLRLRGQGLLSISPRHFSFDVAGSVLSVGVVSAMATLLANCSNMILIKLTSGYGDVPLAANGIVKKIDMVPLQICHGLCQGVMPLVGYQFAAKNFQRLKKVSFFSWALTFAFSGICVILFQLCAPELLSFFIKDADTASLGAELLRIASLALPLQAINAQIGYMLQAMGRGLQASALIVCRQGLLNMPMLFLMNRLSGLYGITRAQLITELLVLPLACIIYFVTIRRAQKAAVQAAVTSQD